MEQSGAPGLLHLTASAAQRLFQELCRQEAAWIQSDSPAMPGPYEAAGAEEGCALCLGTVGTEAGVRTEASSAGGNGISVDGGNGNRGMDAEDEVLRRTSRRRRVDGRFGRRERQATLPSEENAGVHQADLSSVEGDNGSRRAGYCSGEVLVGAVEGGVGLEGVGTGIVHRDADAVNHKYLGFCDPVGGYEIGCDQSSNCSMGDLGGRMGIDVRGDEGVVVRNIDHGCDRLNDSGDGNGPCIGQNEGSFFRMRSGPDTGPPLHLTQIKSKGLVATGWWVLCKC